MRVRTAIALCLPLVLVGVACSSQEDPPAPIAADTLPDTPAGDACQDGTGDLLTDAEDTGRTRSDPAGIDIVSAAAELDDDTLTIRFETLQPIESAPDATFYVQHGDLIQSPSLSWELRIEESDAGAWVLQLITVPTVGRENETTLAVAPTVEGTVATVTIPRADLPAVSSRLWSFGSSAGISADNRVFDECLPYAPSGDGGTTGSTGPTGTGDPSVTAPSVFGDVGQTLEGPDGSRVTVHNVEVPAVPDAEFDLSAVVGTQFATADVEVCASDRQLDDVGERRFLVTLDNGDTRGVVELPKSPHQPQFPVGVTLRPDTCERGWVTFQIAADAGVASVGYDVSGSGVGPVLTFAT